MNNSEFAPEKQGVVIATPSAVMLEAALDYAEKGWPVFPCRPRDSEAGLAKSPYVAGGFKSASSDPATIRAWWTQWPDAMIAAPTGPAIGAWVLDIDDEQAFAAVEGELDLPATRMSRTGKGRHLFFAWENADPVRNAQKCADLPGADIRGEGGYVILPPSIHPAGAAYTWMRDEDASEPPAALMAILRANADRRTVEANDARYAACAAAYSAVAVEELGLPEWVNSEAARLAMVVTPKGARSEAVNGFVAQAIREGWTDVEIGGVLIHPDNAISERVRERSDPKREIDRTIAYYRADERAADGELPHIRDYPRIDWDKFVANGLAKQRAAGLPAAANDSGVGIVRHSPASRVRAPFEFVRVGELQHAEPDWMVDGLFEASALALLFGDPGSGKSFLAIDLAACIATGLPFHGREVAAGAVFYIAGEGHNGLRRRFSAWEAGAGVSLNDAPLFTSKGAANFLDGESADRVAEAVATLARHCPPRLIIVDTLARSFGDGDENSTKDMNAFVRAMDDLRRSYPQATVLIVHHSGHADKGRARGAMALKGALDAEYRTAISGDLVTLSNTKMKEAAKPADMHFQLIDVELGTDRHGEPFGSARLQHIECNIELAGTVRRLKGNRLAVAEAYRLAAVARGDSELSEGVPRGEWRAAFCTAHGKPDSARTIWGREIGKLCEDVPATDAGLCFLKPAVADSLRAK